MTPLFVPIIGLLGIKTSSLAAIGLSIAYVGIVLLRIKARNKKEPWIKFDFASLLELFGVFFAIWFSVYSIEQANDTVNDSRMQLETLKHLDTSSVETKSSLDTLSTKLKQIPAQLDQFANSLENLNKIMESQQKYFTENVDVLDRNISGLKQGIESTSDYIDKFSSELNQVVSLTDKQLKIWEKQQEIVKNEYSRKPILSMHIGEVRNINNDFELGSVHIKNDGNLEAEIRNVFLYFPKCNFDSVYYNLVDFYVAENSDTISFLEPYPNDFRTVVKEIPCFFQIMYRKKQKVRPIIKYKIDYFSKYETGTVIGTIDLNFIAKMQRQ